MNTAKLIKPLQWKGDAAVYALSVPMKYEGGETLFVAVSAVNAFGGAPETYIFPCDESGNVLDWGELKGSFKGDLSHEAALAGAGYEVVS